MAVVKFMPKPWQMEDVNSIVEHIQQFHEKFQELGMIHIPKETDIPFETMTPTINTTSSNNIITLNSICSFVYKFPKGDGVINYSEPDDFGVQEILSFSPKPTDLYIKFNWYTAKTSYYGAVRNSSLLVEIELDREPDFLSGVNRPTYRASPTYYSSWGSSTLHGTIQIEGESVLSLSPDGLVILHGIYTSNNGRTRICGSPRNLIQTVINISDDGVINSYSSGLNVDTSSTDYGSTLNTAYKYCYSYMYYGINGRYTFYDRPINVTPFPFNDISNNVYGELQGLPCYGMDKKYNVIETYQTYTFQRGISNGEHDFIVYRDGKVLKRQIYIQELNSMTPQTRGTWSDTWADYNREYGHIIEYAPLVNLT